MSHVLPSGTWSSSNTAVATVNFAGGVVGVAAGTCIMSYQVSGSCGSVLATKIVTVYQSPAPITGAGTICTGNSITLADATPGGNWTSATPSAYIDAVTGVVTGISVSSFIPITYTMPNMCYATTSVSVSGYATTGAASVCVGSSATLTNSDPGGTWSSSNSSVISVGSGSGVVTGVSAGTAMISYTTTAGCIITRVQTCLVTPAISGPTKVCVGSTILLTNTVPDGTWSSSNISRATVNSSGVVTGGSAGTVIITNTTGSCFASVTVTVGALSATISGTGVTCVGNTTTLTCGATGTWSSASPAIAVISSTGVVTGAGPGSATINYTLSSGCSPSKVVTVNAAPSSLTGALSICVGSTAALSNTSPGGTWTSGNPSVATINSAGVLTGINTGTAPITYTVAGGCAVTAMVTVNSTSTSITGSTAVCVGSGVTLASGSGGTWSCSDITKANVSTGGVVSGLSPGMVTIAYNVSSGCSPTKVVTVNTSPGPIIMSSALCTGLSVVLSNSVSGGTWSNSNPAVANITGGNILNGLAGGVTTISYTLPNGCVATSNATVSPLASGISGASTVCVGHTATLVVGGVGVWSSSAPAVAEITGLGYLSGMAPGAALISFTSTAGCILTRQVTVYATPSAITGSSSICGGATVSLSETTTGGTWSTAAPNLSVTTGGVVTGLSAGTGGVSYTTGAGCTAVMVLTVNAPPAIVGVPTACIGTTTTLTNSLPGGTWTSGNLSVATVSGGVVNALSLGIANISYTVGGCSAVITVTVGNSSSPITGPSEICTGIAQAFGDAIPGGTWNTTSGNITMGSSGTVTGISAGTAKISYSLSSGCNATKVITVTTSPSSISGPGSVCTGASITLSNSVSGGIWTSSNSSVADVSSTGVVSGASPGVATISYATSSVCYQVKSISVNAVPASITGPAEICTGVAQAYSDATPGGTWSTVASNITLGSSGTVTGISSGTATISYNSSGCYTTKVITVTTSPSSITGAGSVCAGASITLSNTISGGTWTSSSSSVGTVSSTGVVNGASPGVVTISYATSGVCSQVRSVTVNAMPAGITGPATLCSGTVSSLSNTVGAGAWVSSDPSVITIDGAGAATAISSGTAIISYTLPGGCYTTLAVTVYSTPSAILGPDSVCVGNDVVLTDATPGGTWSSANGSIASASSGTVTGVSAGITTISYITGGLCYRTISVSVNPSPGAITGVAAACVGSVTTLSCPGGGTWVSSNASVASVNSAGVVSGLLEGNTTINYTVAGCSTVKEVTINPLPGAITGVASLCLGGSSMLANTISGGSWSSSSPAVTVGSTGAITGVATGTSTISYVLPTGCGITRVVTVNVLPAAITGPLSVCPGDSITLVSATTGGTWSSSNIAIAGIGSAGVLGGVSTGSSMISYILPTGCYATRTTTVLASPSAISGPSSLCHTANAVLSNSVAGGTWSSASLTVATMSTSGIVTGVGAGTTLISYVLSTGCFATKSITVDPLPAPIAGPASACDGDVIHLTDPTTGGLWQCSDTTVATVDIDGFVTTLDSGTAMISYVLPTGCMATQPVAVRPRPDAISGPDEVCMESAIWLSDATPAGTWSSASNAIATVATTGMVTGLHDGVVTISYVLASGCYRTKDLTVNPLPVIAGQTVVCAGNAATLSSGQSGTWSSSNSTIASVADPSQGYLQAIQQGAAMVTFTAQATGCADTAIVIVRATPAAIGGVLSVCTGSHTTVSNSLPGGAWSIMDTSVTRIDSLGYVEGLTVGTTTVVYRSKEGCSTSAVITVNALPQQISAPSHMCPGETTTLQSPDAVQWTISDTALARLTVVVGSAVLTAKDTGIVTIGYSLQATGCSADTFIHIIQCDDIGDFSIYPNPGNGEFFAKAPEDGKLTLYTIDGKQLASFAIKRGINKIDIASSIAAGVYVCRYTGNSGRRAERKLVHLPQ